LFLTPTDILALTLTFKLAFVTTLLLLLISTPLAWFLSRWNSPWRALFESVIALPLILPPTVLGFYLLIFLAPDSFLGASWYHLTGHQLAFSFTGLVIASMVYSLPFVVQPLQLAFEKIDPTTLECAKVLGASNWRRFTSIIIPSTRNSFLLASVLGFAHTIGEFGVVLMIGGNIPGETQVLSLVLYDYVESLDYDAAHRLAATLVCFSVVMLIIVYSLNRGTLLRKRVTSSTSKIITSAKGV
jgi:molybdate transport system permease protein